MDHCEGESVSGGSTQVLMLAVVFGSLCFPTEVSQDCRYPKFGVLVLDI